MMRRLVSLLPLIPFVAAAWMAPRPGLREISGDAAWAPDSTILLKTRVVLRNFALATDTVHYTFFRNGALVATRRLQLDIASASVQAPAYGQTLPYQGCARIERGGRTSGKVYPPTPVCWPARNVTRPDTAPDPIIDSILDVSPSAVSIAPGAVQQFTATWRVQ